MLLLGLLLLLLLLFLFKDSVNQQRVVDKFECDFCDASYVGHTLRHLHLRAAEYTEQSSSIGKRFISEHCIVPKDLNRHFFRSQEMQE